MPPGGINIGFIIIFQLPKNSWIADCASVEWGASVGVKKTKKLASFFSFFFFQFSDGHYGR